MQKLKTIVLVIIILLGLLALYIPKSSASYFVVTQDNIKIYSFREVEKNWHFKEWQSFSQIIRRESSWNYKAKNKHSSATGLCQTMLSLYDVPDNFLENPEVQIDWCIKYIQDRYGSPSKALAFWNRHHWF